MAKGHKGPDIMPLDIQSPILRIRMIKGLTKAEMALVLATTDTTIKSMERGSIGIDATAQEALTKLGEDGTKISDEQEVFIKRRREWLTKRFLEGE